MAKDDFLGKLTGSQERAQLMRVFLFNQSEAFTLAALTKRAGVSLQAVRREVKKLEALGIARKGKPGGRLMKLAVVKVAGKKKPQREAAFSTPEFRCRLTIQDKLIRDTLDFPHLVLWDRARLL